MTEYLALGLLIFALVNISIWPPLIYFQNRQISEQISRLIVEIPDDPDPGAGEDEPAEPSNVVAIGKRAA